jgi:hypothetical protein
MVSSMKLMGTQKAGYTGTLTSHGRAVTLSNAQPGDLVFCKYPPHESSLFRVWILTGYVECCRW